MTENKVGKGLVISLGEQMVTLRSQLKHIEFPSPVLALGQFGGLWLCCVLMALPHLPGRSTGCSAGLW